MTMLTPFRNQTFLGVTKLFEMFPMQNRVVCPNMADKCLVEYRLTGTQHAA